MHFLELSEANTRLLLHILDTPLNVMYRHLGKFSKIRPLQKVNFIP